MQVSAADALQTLSKAGSPSIKFCLSIMIEGATMQEIGDGLVQAAGQHVVRQLKTAPTMPPQPSTQAMTEIKAAIEEIPGLANAVPKVETRGRKPKAVTEAAAEPVPETPAAVAFTVDDVKKAILSVSEKFGIDKARECLAKFNAPKASEIKPADFEAFVAHCKSLVG